MFHVLLFFPGSVVVIELIVSNEIVVALETTTGAVRFPHSPQSKIVLLQSIFIFLVQELSNSSTYTMINPNKVEELLAPTLLYAIGYELCIPRVRSTFQCKSIQGYVFFLIWSYM